MANRYWVGGTASWDGTAGTKWALTDGGAGGQAIPTSADDVFFTATSGVVTCTIATGNTGAKSITCTGFTGTLAGTATITVSGSVTLVAGMTFTFTGITTIAGTATITSAGKILPRLVISGAGIVVNQADAFNLGSQQLNIIQGTYNTNNYSLFCFCLQSQGVNTRTLNLGSSVVTVTFSSATIFSGSNFTFDAGTSTITANTTDQVTLDNIGAYTFYNVSFTGTGANTTIILGNNIFNNLTITAPAAAGVRQVTFDSRNTINGTLSTTGTAGNRRVWFRGVTYGIAQTLTINSAASLTDADFRDIYVIGTAAPISGTRIGDLRGISGITASTPKTVYWNLAGAQNWSATGWATTSTGTPSTDNFPLAQDIATFTNAGSVTGTITMNSAIPYTGTVDMSGRTSAMTLTTTAFTIYGDWKNGTGTTLSGTAELTFSGRNTQTITSAGKTFTQPITVDSYGGSVELADALATNSQAITITNGTFNTKNFNVTASQLSSSNSNIRAINLGSSTVSLTAITFTTATNLTFNAGTSSINLIGVSSGIDGSATFYNVSFTSSTVGTRTIQQSCVFNNLTIAAGSTGIVEMRVYANQTINGTLTAAGATATQRIFLSSSVLGTARTLTVNTLSAQDCDFRDIAIAGAAAGSSPTRAGDCGGNSGITFPAAKTVYWNLAGAQNWSATGWAPGSGGTPAINNFPLAQDTAVFDNAGSAGTVTIDVSWNIGTFDSSARTSAMTLANGFTQLAIYKNWTNGSGLTLSGTGAINFRGRGTQTITSAAKTFTQAININSISGTIQLADALQAGSGLTLASGTFDAVSYNVTATQVTGSSPGVLKMGSGTWTITGTGTAWNFGGAPTLYKGTANIVLSDISTAARTFAGGSLAYNKLTIGGTTGISITTISGDNTFSELASTKTVAHTVTFATSSTQTIGKWSITGTVGNVVTVNSSSAGTTFTLSIAGPANSGIDYLSIRDCFVALLSGGEFYVGANSTNVSANVRVVFTATPAPRTLYWVGGTGSWSSTTKWSLTSGGASGAAVPTSLDAVIFNSASNATAYTATQDVAGARCASFTMAGPAAGNVTFAGTTQTIFHGNVSFAATGITRTYTGFMFLYGNSTYTFTTNGLTLASGIIVYGIGSTWTLGSALNVGTGEVTVNTGSLSLSVYNLTCGNFNSNNSFSRTINLGSSTITSSGTSSFNNSTNLTFTPGTSTLSYSSAAATFAGGGNTFYNAAFTNTTAASTVSITGVNTFNNLSFTGLVASGIKTISVASNQTISGTLTLSAGTDATMRQFLQSDTIGTTRTLTCAAFSGTDADFRDITIAGAAAPASGTRLGDAKGNSGITFGAGVNKYWNLAAGGSWSAIGWATSSGGTPAVNNFPLAQDSAIFEATGLNSGAGISVFSAYNIGTINMSARTTNTIAFATGAFSFAIYGDWINGTGTTISGTGSLTFAGRGAQKITTAGKVWTTTLVITSPGGSVTLQDSFTSNRSAFPALDILFGTFDANGFNVTFTDSAAGIRSETSNVRTIAIGSGLWTTPINCNFAVPTNLTVTGTGTISLTSASAKAFNGGGISYSGITLNQGGAGTLTVSGNNTFKDITNTYKATGATTIALANTTQTVSQFTAAGEAGRLLTITGTSASSPATLVLTGVVDPSVDYVTITGVRAYNLVDTWYAGANSINNGSLGWIFASAVALATGSFFLLF